METAPNTIPSLNETQRLKKSRQIGMWTFFTAATLQMLVLGLLFVSFVFYHYRRLRSFEYRTDTLSESMPPMDQIYDPTSEKWLHEIYIFVPALLVGGLTFMLLTGWLGKQAGQRIGIQGHRYGWVGITTVILPSILASLALVTAYTIIDESMRKWLFGHFYRDVVVPTLVFAAIFFVPAIATGILAGFVTRQRIRGWEHSETVYAQSLFPI